MSNQPLTVVLPSGRVVQGDLYTGDATDMDGKPKVYAAGHQNAGQPQISYFFAVAIPKEAGHTHWGQTAWGSQILAFGRAAWPSGQAEAPSFAWKIEDGDSVTPNRKGNKNADREGHKGNWIVKLSSSFAPRLYSRDATGRAAEWLVKDAVKPGDFVQVQITVASNERASNPGVYLNHSMVMFQGYGDRIRMGADPNAVQWAAPPAGASTVPSGAAMPSTTLPPAAAAPGAPPALPGAGTVVLPAAAPTAAAPPPALPVTPSASFAAPPAPPGAAPAPPAPPAAGPQMTAKAGAYTYAQMIAAGWNDGTLRANGYMS